MDLNEMDPQTEEEFEEDESGDTQEELSMCLSLLDDCVKKMESAIGDGNPHRLTWMIIKEMKDTALEATAFLEQYEMGRDFEQSDQGKNDQPPANYNPEEGEKKETQIHLNMAGSGVCCYPRFPARMGPHFRNIRADMIRIEGRQQKVVEGEVVDEIDYFGEQGETWD